MEPIVSTETSAIRTQTPGNYPKRNNLHSSTCFEHYELIIQRPKLYYTASGIITPVGGRPVHRLRGLCTGRPPTRVMIPDAV